MSKFDELQQIHQHLLERLDDVTDKTAFAREVQAYISQVCDEAVDVPAPRDRDQLRANLRFWASYVYDATGTYPNTTMRPARLSGVESLEGVPPPAAAAPAPTPAVPSTTPASPPTSGFNWRSLLVGAIVLLLVGVMFLWARSNPQSAPTTSGSESQAATVRPTALAEELTLSWRVVTAGPSPFSAITWVVRIELIATGGNGEYIFWINGQRLPEASNNQFTVESQGCQPVDQFIGVTSGGRATRQQLVIYPPEPNSCSK
jgi:hypothetical protein